MKKLVVSGTSFLVPANRAWRELGESYQLQFADYGHWDGALLNTPPDQLLAVIVCFDDLFAAFERVAASDASRVAESFFALLERRLSTALEPTLVGFAHCDATGPIRRAKGLSERGARARSFIGDLQAMAAERAGLYAVELDLDLARIGYAQALDARNWYFAHCRFSSRGLEAVAQTLCRVLARIHAPPRKALVLDCDNTLWGGVVGEDGIGGLTLGQDGAGQAFADFQKAARALVGEGVLLALASKNNEDEVWEVFRSHPAMSLGRADLVSWRINWNDKADNIRAMAEELDLGLDSFVFWDDNPIERDLVRRRLPEVLTVEVPDDVLAWPGLLAELDCFAKFSLTEEDANKTRQYQNRAKFVRDKATVGDERDYLRSIKLSPAASGLERANLARAEQLCAKTNQFNLRTARHAEDALRRMAEEAPDLCFLASLSDIYGDHGTVGLVCLRAIDRHSAFLDTFLMSCRILGRHFEAWMMGQALARARDGGFRWLVAEFIDSGRNAVAKGFLEACGFARLGSAEVCQTGWPQELLAKDGEQYVASTDLAGIPYCEVYADTPAREAEA